MTEKEIALRLREMSYNEDWYENTKHMGSALEAFADELDPPTPEPGTVVWWRLPHGGAWRTGIVCPGDDRRLHIQGGSLGMEDMAFVEWKPAYVAPPNTDPGTAALIDELQNRIAELEERQLAPDEVAVKVPHIDLWPKGVSERAELVWNFYDKSGACFNRLLAKNDPVTRAEAKEMHRE